MLVCWRPRGWSTGFRLQLASAGSPTLLLTCNTCRKFSRTFTHLLPFTPTGVLLVCCIEGFFGVFCEVTLCSFDLIETFAKAGCHTACITCFDLIGCLSVTPYLQKQFHFREMPPHGETATKANYLISTFRISLAVLCFLSFAQSLCSKEEKKKKASVISDFLLGRVSLEKQAAVVIWMQISPSNLNQSQTISLALTDTKTITPRGGNQQMYCCSAVKAENIYFWIDELQI